MRDERVTNMHMHMHSAQATSARGAASGRYDTSSCVGAYILVVSFGISTEVRE